MKDTIARDSRHMLILAPDPARVAQYQHIIPEATVIDARILSDDTASAAWLNTQEGRWPFRNTIIVNRPPLDVAETVRRLRATPMGRDLYIAVLTPPDIPFNPDTQLDVDDQVDLPDSESIPAILRTAHLRYERNMALREKFLQATRTARSAMASAAAYGSLIHFFDTSEQCQNLEELADLVQTFLDEKKLSATICIRTGERQIYRPARQPSASRRYLLDQLAAAGRRMVSVERILGLHIDHVTLLIANCPVEDAEGFGQLKDSLAHFGTLVESRIKQILVKEQIARQHEEVLSIMQLIRTATDESNQQIKRIMLRLGHDIELAAHTFDMNIEEERKLLELAGNAADSLDQLQENDSLIEDHFLSLIGSITSLMHLVSEQAREEAGDSVELF